MFVRMFMSQKLLLTSGSGRKRLCSFDMFSPISVNTNTNWKKSPLQTKETILIVIMTLLLFRFERQRSLNKLCTLRNYRRPGCFII